MRLSPVWTLAKQNRQNKDVLRGKQYWRIWKTEDYYLQQKLLHAFAVVMKQCIRLKT
ncbi:hypothetical protein [Klebsiella pneumoniae]|uniref:hypothetical protein n=1 Tax=Klebsiella pneumoniae TaxID=573 RepID=UPI0022B6C596|nr:hypothetical protein [Klebsiella pneumoniae]